MNKVCAICGKSFYVKPSRDDKAKYCSRKCMGLGMRGKKLFKCFLCGKTHDRYPCKFNSEKYFCSNKCKLSYQKMEGHPKWRGGYFVDTKGYRVMKNEEYPKGIYEHRYVMQNHVNRVLMKDEVVHHKNGDKLDNRIENLELLSNSDHVRKHSIIHSDRWALKYDCCVDCGTNEKKHYAKGRCYNCYMRNRYNEKKHIS